jgi:hypothetical protein
LLDDQAVLACLAYVNLDLVRAGIADTPETSDYSPIQRRIQTLQGVSQQAGNDVSVEERSRSLPTQPPELYPFVGGSREAMPEGLPFHLADYLEPVNWTGQAVPEDKRGWISKDLPPILDRFRIEPKAWLQPATEFETQFIRWIGKAGRVEEVLAGGPNGWVSLIS